MKREITPATKALGAPFKPYFGLSGLRCLPNPFVIRTGENPDFLLCSPHRSDRLTAGLKLRPLRTGASTEVVRHVRRCDTVADAQSLPGLRSSRVFPACLPSRRGLFAADPRAADRPDLAELHRAAVAQPLSQHHSRAAGSRHGPTPMRAASFRTLATTPSATPSSPT